MVVASIVARVRPESLIPPAAGVEENRGLSVTIFETLCCAGIYRFWTSGMRRVLVSVILLGECDRFDVMKPLAGPHCRRKITPTIHIMIRVPVSSC